MLNQSTFDKLVEMRLTAMANAFRVQMNDPKVRITYIRVRGSPSDPAGAAEELSKSINHEESDLLTVSCQNVYLLL